MGADTIPLAQKQSPLGRHDTVSEETNAMGAVAIPLAKKPFQSELPKSLAGRILEN
jgi:hypothetical protein